MANFDNKKIQEAAYFIWQSKGCPMNSSASDWNEAIEQLERQDALNMANAVSSLYSKCTLIPSLERRVKRAAAAASAPYLCVKSLAAAANLNTIAKPAKKSVVKKAVSAVKKKVKVAAKAVASAKKKSK